MLAAAAPAATFASAPFFLIADRIGLVRIKCKAG